jgi:CRP-like cAMP-binding protein
MDEISLESGQVLIERGRLNDTFFVLLDGEVEVRARDRRRRRLGRGEFFGEISMESQRPATATVVARKPGRALVMSRSQYRAVRASAPVRARLMNAMSARLEADRRMVAVLEPAAVAAPRRPSLTKRLVRLASRLQPYDGMPVYRPYCPRCYGGGGCSLHGPHDWRAGL